MLVSMRGNLFAQYLRMNRATPPTPSRSLQALTMILYILAGIVLVPGLIAGISLLIGAGNIAANLLLPLQMMGAAPAFNLLNPMLKALLINLGAVILIVSLVISTLLFTVGRLVSRIALLEARLDNLEIHP